MLNGSCVLFTCVIKLIFFSLFILSLNVTEQNCCYYFFNIGETIDVHLRSFLSPEFVWKF